jgi:glutaminyl-peptide cyclotransferase
VGRLAEPGLASGTLRPSVGALPHPQPLSPGEKGASPQLRSIPVLGCYLALAIACGADGSAPPASPAAVSSLPKSVLATPAVTGGPARVPVLVPRVMAEWPHDPRAFTQGLVFDRGQLLESTGQYGVSELRRVELESGRVLARVPLDASLFGEGLALVGDRLIQLTWQEGRAFVYQAASLERIAEWRYQGEGWGLTFDGQRLVMSDGSDILTFRDPRTFAHLGRLRVTLDGAPLPALNELEWAAGAIWANVWQTDRIVRIEPESGQVTAVVDASGLLRADERAGADVLNGIAYDAGRRVFYLTGKLWPRVFEVELAN